MVSVILLSSWSGCQICVQHIHIIPHCLCISLSCLCLLWFYFVGLCLTSDRPPSPLVCSWGAAVPGGMQDGLSKSQPPGRTVLEETLEMVEQWAAFDEGRCFWGVSIISSTAEPRRSPVSGPWYPPDMLLVTCGFHSGVRSYHLTDLREGESCRLGKDLAHFHWATLPFSTKAFTSNCSNPLPKKRAVFLPSSKS